MESTRVQAFAARLAADAVREAIPTENDLAEAELFGAQEAAAVMRELERLADKLLAEAMRLESL